MRLFKLLAVLFVVTTVTGCACHTKKVGPEENIPVPTDSGPIADIHFDFDRYAITDEAKPILAQGADWLKANPSATVQVEGHCDERGTAEYNMALGMKRANAGAAYLRSLGVEKSRISTISYGEDLPIDPAHNEAAWAKNRRDHFKVETNK